jgi:(E)-4-hydroxy-3-methylbut-2-enyl-diphosphate synthase
VESALDKVSMIEDAGYDNIVVSIKSSDVLMCVKAHELLAPKCRYPLHVGITEAGTLRSGNIKSAIGLGLILSKGIGDTIRVSVSGPPKDELIIAKQLLRSFDLADRVPDLVACPTCGRIQYDMLPLVKEMEDYLQSVRANITVAVMGCPVNGMQEASRADVGVAGGHETGMLFRKGQLVRTVPQAELADALKHEIQKIISEMENAQ